MEVLVVEDMADGMVAYRAVLAVVAEEKVVVDTVAVVELRGAEVIQAVAMVLEVAADNTHLVEVEPPLFHSIDFVRMLPGYKDKHNVV